MANPVTGTFSATGSSESVAGNKVAIMADFAGTATVNVQWFMNGDWRTIQSFTADFNEVYEGPSVPVRLNCSAHTNNVVYELHAY